MDLHLAFAKIMQKGQHINEPPNLRALYTQKMTTKSLACSNQLVEYSHRYVIEMLPTLGAAQPSLQLWIRRPVLNLET